MKTIGTFFFLGTSVAASLLLNSGCQDSFKDCENALTCEPPGDGDGDGDGDTGGTGGGDGDGDGSGGNGTGGAPDVTCQPACSEDAYCNEALECVECLEHAHCSGETDLCDTEAGTCVQCLGEIDCDASMPVCEGGSCLGCVDSVDCERFSSSGTPACDVDTGECVECNDMNDCEGNVCDPSSHTCTNIPARTEFACEECAFDEQCAEGHVCVEMSYDDPPDVIVGSFCLWEMAAALPGPNGGCGLNSRPYAQQATVTTVDGSEVTVCRPRTSTCPAVLQHATVVAGCETPFTDDAACGAEGFNDGRCRLSGADIMCTYPCLGADARDCPAGSTCVEGGDRYCSF